MPTLTEEELDYYKDLSSDIAIYKNQIMLWCHRRFEREQEHSSDLEIEHCIEKVHKYKDLYSESYQKLKEFYNKIRKKYSVKKKYTPKIDIRTGIVLNSWRKK